MTTQLSFSVREDTDDETDKLIHYGTFSRDWTEEEVLDELIDSLDAGIISHKQALLRAQKLLLKFPGQLEIQNFIANRLWNLELRDEATDVWANAYRQATALIPAGFKGQINWFEIDNRSFLRIAHGYLLGLMHRSAGKAAKALSKKLLAWCPGDNLGVRMLMGDISMMTGDTKSAIKSYLKEAADSPAHWYQAGQIAFREGDFVSACTYMRRGIAANPYIAEGLTGRTKINEHLYWHASTRNGPEWATDYLSAPVCNWTPQEIDFVDWVFNSSAVLRERANLMDQHEGLTYEHDAVRRQPFALRSTYFVNELSDDMSKAMVKKVQNRYGVEIWPWELRQIANSNTSDKTRS
jgi:tetratricopeptide (TPR) repeat protein